MAVQFDRYKHWENQIGPCDNIRDVITGKDSNYRNKQYFKYKDELKEELHEVSNSETKISFSDLFAIVEYLAGNRTDTEMMWLRLNTIITRARNGRDKINFMRYMIRRLELEDEDIKEGDDYDVVEAV